MPIRKTGVSLLRPQRKVAFVLCTQAVDDFWATEGGERILENKCYVPEPDTLRSIGSLEA